jgi:hypothetical protein
VSSPDVARQRDRFFYVTENGNFGVDAPAEDDSGYSASILLIVLTLLFLNMYLIYQNGYSAPILLIVLILLFLNMYLIYQNGYSASIHLIVLILLFLNMYLLHHSGPKRENFV